MSASTLSYANEKWHR